MNLLLLAMLVVHPVLDEPQDLRMVAVGVDGASVTWELDGVPIATTQDREAVSVPVSAGPHRLVAHADVEGPWEILARPEPRGEGAVLVAAWSAKHDGADLGAATPWWTSIWARASSAIIVAAMMVVVPRLRERRQGEAAINPLQLAEACTSTPGENRNTRTTPNSAKSSASPSSEPMSGTPSRNPMP